MISTIWDNLFTWVLLYTSFSIIGFYLFLRFTRNSLKESFNELVINTFNSSGVLFSLLITFVIVTVWENWKQMENNIVIETNVLSNMMNHTHHLPPEYRQSLRQNIKLYTKSLIEDEWPSMALGEAGEKSKQRKKTNAAFMLLRVEIHRLYDIPDDNRYQFDNIFPLYVELSDMRRNRLHQNKDYLPPMVWYILFTGSFVTIFISFFYKADNLNIQYLMNFLQALMFSMGMFIAYDLSNPFTGESRITPEIFQNVLEKQFTISETPAN